MNKDKSNGFSLEKVDEDIREVMSFYCSSSSSL